MSSGSLTGIGVTCDDKGRCVIVDEAYPPDAVKGRIREVQRLTGCTVDGNTSPLASRSRSRDVRECDVIYCAVSVGADGLRNRAARAIERDVAQVERVARRDKEPSAIIAVADAAIVGVAAGFTIVVVLSAPIMVRSLSITICPVSVYVPTATLIVSPAPAAAIASWIVA